MHQPSVSDFTLLKQILRYVKGTFELGISLKATTHSTLLCYSDSDWAGCKETRRSTRGFCTFLGSNLISWSAKRHETVSKSSTEAEYRTMSLAASKVAWMQNLLQVMGLQQKVAPLLLCDNLSAICLAANPMFHKRTKHFDIDFHYVRERVAMKKLEVKHIPATLQLADVFTKSLPQDSYFNLRAKLGVSQPSPLSLRGGNGNTGYGPSFPSHEAHITSPTKVSQALPLSSSVTKVVKGQRPCSAQIQDCRTSMTAKSITVANRFDPLNTCAVMC